MNTLDRALYRGKCVETGKWCIGSLNIFEDSVTINICKVVNANIGQPENIQVEMDVVPETVGQFTGLTDKNGVKVFEGDVIYIAGAGLYSIFYSTPDMQWLFESANGNIDWPLAYQEVIEDIESIRGNIHDNPELIEVSK